jgi:hypothetical protein
MPTHVQLPDGSIGEFPDGMTDQQIEAVLQKQFPQQQAQPQPPEQPSALSRFLSSAVTPIKGAVQGLDPRPTDAETQQGLTTPYDYVLRPFERVVESHLEQAKEARDAAKSGRVAEALGHGLATITPVVGPYAAGVGETLGKQAGSGDVAGAMGTGAGNVALLLAPKAVGKAAEVAKDAAPALVRAATGTGPKTVGELVKQTKAANEAADVKHASQSQDAVNTQRDTRLQSLKSKREAQAQNEAEVEQVREENKQALEANRQAEEMPARRQTAYRELQGQIETAREKALKEGNKKYNAVNEALNPIDADMDKLNNLYFEAAESLGETQAEPTLLKRLGKALENNGALTYKDLQSMYSELGKELSKGTLDGKLYHAYDVLHEGIGEDMQRIADSQGQGAQLTAARNYWRRMKQAFGKPYNPSDVATKTMEGASSDIARAEEESNRRRLLASFDPSIQGTFEHVDNLERGAKALGPPKPLRDILKPNPQKPGITVPRMQDADVPDRPTPQVINSEDIQNAKKAALEKSAEKVRRRGAAIVTTLGAYRALSDAFHGNYGSIPTLLGESGVGLAATYGLSKLMEHPAIVDYLTKATAKDVAAIPPELRGDLPAIVKAAQAKGIRVSPALTGAVAAGATSGQQRNRVAAALKP